MIGKSAENEFYPIPDTVVADDPNNPGKKIVFTCEKIIDASGKEVISEFGRGGMGWVIRARDPNGKLVAIRFPQTEVEKREKQMAREVSIYHVSGELLGEVKPNAQDPRHIAVVEAVPGRMLGGVAYHTEQLPEFKGKDEKGKDIINLRDVQRKDPFTLEEKKAFTYALLKQVYGRMQLHGIVHCDLKPDNIMVHKATRTGKAVDMGEAFRLQDPFQNRQPHFVAAGDVYSPPEIRGKGTWREGVPDENNFRTDMYCLGMVLADIWSDANFVDGTRDSAVDPKTALPDIFDPTRPRPAGMPEDVLQIIQALTAQDPKDAPANIGVAVLSVKQNLSPELASIYNAQNALEEIKGKLLVDLKKDKRFSKDYAGNSKGYGEIAENNRKAQQFHNFITANFNGLNNVKANINRAFDQKLADLAGQKEVSPEDEKFLLELANNTNLSPIKKMEALSGYIKMKMDNNPPPLLAVLEGKRDLATIRAQMQRIVESRPESADAKYIVENQLMENIDRHCKTWSDHINKERTAKLNEYPEAVKTIVKELSVMADAHRIQSTSLTVAFSAGGMGASGHKLDPTGQVIYQAFNELKNVNEAGLSYPNLPAPAVEAALGVTRKALEEKLDENKEKIRRLQTPSEMRKEREEQKELEAKMRVEARRGGNESPDSKIIDKDVKKDVKENEGKELEEEHKEDKKEDKKEKEEDKRKLRVGSSPFKQKIERKGSTARLQVPGRKTETTPINKSPEGSPGSSPLRSVPQHMDPEKAKLIKKLDDEVKHLNQQLDTLTKLSQRFDSVKSQAPEPKAPKEEEKRHVSPS